MYIRFQIVAALATLHGLAAKEGETIFFSVWSGSKLQPLDYFAQKDAKTWGGMCDNVRLSGFTGLAVCPSRSWQRAFPLTCDGVQSQKYQVDAFTRLNGAPCPDPTVTWDGMDAVVAIDDQCRQL